MKYEELLEEVKTLNLDIKEYAVFGSGPLAVRGLRESNDIDIIVTEKLWENLEKQNDVQDDRIIIGNVEIWHNWKPWIEDIEQLIKSAELIKETPHVQLKYIKEWKKKMGREKDLQDIRLIEKFLDK